MKKIGVKKGSAQAKSYAERKEKDKQWWTMKVLAWTQQEMLDAVMLTLYEYYGFGPERQKRFHDHFEEKYAELRKLEREDCEDNEYYIEKVEQALKVATGKYYTPRNERYNIHIRDENGNTVSLGFD